MIDVPRHICAKLNSNIPDIIVVIYEEISIMNVLNHDIKKKGKMGYFNANTPYKE